MWTQILDSMVYKTFEWPNNPATCSYDVDRSYAKHKYPELKGTEIEDFDPNAVIVSGTGEFFGDGAYDTWLDLVRVFNTHSPGKFFHPIYTDVKFGLMTKLKSDMEPREDYIKYSFEIVKHDNHMPSVILQPIKKSTGGGGGTQNPNTGGDDGLGVGDVVIVNGIAYYTSYGSIQIPVDDWSNINDNPPTGAGGGTVTSPTANLVNRTMTITQIVDMSRAYPIHVGSVGWVAVSSVRKK